jgi:hypothetical protein
MLAALTNRAFPGRRGAGGGFVHRVRHLVGGFNGILV